jgi:hypothetical protein
MDLLTDKSNYYYIDIIRKRKYVAATDIHNFWDW